MAPEIPQAGVLLLPTPTQGEDSAQQRWEGMADSQVGEGRAEKNGLKKDTFGLYASSQFANSVHISYSV